VKEVSKTCAGSEEEPARFPCTWDSVSWNGDAVWLGSVIYLVMLSVVSLLSVSTWWFHRQLIVHMGLD